MCVIPPEIESREPEIIADIVRRVSKKQIPQEKRMVQPLIHPMFKKMRMTVNLAKTKRDEEEVMDLEVFSNEKHFVRYDTYGRGKIKVS